MSELVQNIERVATRLVLATVDEMYRNPFWDARFGERGRTFAADDGRHHVSYLVQALIAKNSDLLANYARWLQSVLTCRGICTRHLAENFQRLSAAIAREGFAGGEEAVRYLGLAEAALEYAEGPPQELQRASVRIAHAAAASMHVEDGLYHLSYLADSLALQRPDLFTTHCVWASAFREGRSGLPRGHLSQFLATVGALLTMDEALSNELRTTAALTLEAGRRAIPA